MTSQRISLVGGLLLLLLSVLSGIVYDCLLMEEYHQEMVYNLEMAADMATKGEGALASTYIRQFGVISEVNNIESRIQTVLVLAGVMTLMPLWLTSKSGFSERMKRIMALFIIFGGLILATGGLLWNLTGAAVAYCFFVAGYGWLLVGGFGYFIYAVLFVWLNADINAKRG
ncbi:MAG: hypothetical protein H6Q73_1521 [Firmicutes bacterium]|nr:hypothetical protein [Bacillota bacterium]